MDGRDKNIPVKRSNLLKMGDYAKRVQGKPVEEGGKHEQEAQSYHRHQGHDREVQKDHDRQKRKQEPA
jgi:hypothetical protein